MSISRSSLCAVMLAAMMCCGCMRDADLTVPLGTDVEKEPPVTLEGLSGAGEQTPASDGNGAGGQEVAHTSAKGDQGDAPSGDGKAEDGGGEQAQATFDPSEYASTNVESSDGETSVYGAYVKWRIWRAGDVVKVAVDVSSHPVEGEISFDVKVMASGDVGTIATKHVDAKAIADGKGHIEFEVKDGITPDVAVESLVVDIIDANEGKSETDVDMSEDDLAGWDALSD